jgi:hypothetical protein
VGGRRSWTTDAPTVRPSTAQLLQRLTRADELPVVEEPNALDGSIRVVRLFEAALAHLLSAPSPY